MAFEAEVPEAVFEYWAEVDHPWNGPGWYYYDRAHPDFGGYGGFDTRALAEADARLHGFRVVERGAS